MTILMALRYFHGVSLAGLGRWFGVHRSSVYRRLLGLVRGGWAPMVARVVRGVCSGVACVDEKWLRIHGQWWYFFVAVEAQTSLLLHLALLLSCTEATCRWFLMGLKRQGYRPWALVTDGLKSYEGAIRRCFPQALHQRYLFHVLQAAGRWLREHLSAEHSSRGPLTGVIGRIFQTGDRRTVWRRFARFQQQARDWGVRRPLVST